MISESEKERRIQQHNAMRKQAAAQELMQRAKQSRDKTNKAFSELADGLRRAENTLEAIMTPVGKFLVKHCGLETGQPMPLWDDLYEALCKALPENGHIPDQDEPRD